MGKKGSGWKWVIGILIGIILIFSGFYLFARVENRVLDQAARNEAGGEFIELDHGFVHYFLEGPSQGPVIVLIHGFSVPAYVWEPTTNYLNDQGYRTLRFDLYGRGYSDRPDLVYDLSLFTAQASGLILALELDEPITLIGLSMGGPIAARLAHQNMEMINGVVLFAPEVKQTTKSDIFPLNIPLLGEYLMTAVMEPFVLPAMQMEDFIQPGNYPEWIDKYRVQLEFEGTGRALLSTIRELVDLDPKAEYRSLQQTGMPVLLIWGEDDQTIGRDQIDILQQILPEIETWTSKEGGHLLGYEYPEDVNPVLSGFLDRIRE